MILFTIGIFMGVTAVMFWRLHQKIKAVEKNNLQLENGLKACADAMFEVTKLCDIAYKASNGQAKVILDAHNLAIETNMDLANFKKEVLEFVKIVTEQVTLLKGRESKSASGNLFAPAKKNDKIKPN